MSEIELEEAFCRIGKKYGFESVIVRFRPFREFKTRWRKDPRHVYVEIPDYLEDAPKKVLENMAEMIFLQITKQPWKDDQKELADWTSSEEFVKNKQAIYIARARNITDSPIGTHRDLRESYERLISQGFAERDKDLKITWTKKKNMWKLGHCSPLLKVIIISAALDSPNVPEFVCDYILYHELLHTKQSGKPFSVGHGADFKEQEKQYPKREEAEKLLKNLELYI
jgi:predicted metal-dependent hydrolase